ncbi:conserved unknown protein [Ectocarpus siliculosus]|uniref:Plastid lipid-associated protein/fibrillin conserved domain-containing protein n=1 Tax=Ectocarpus siliculosus TaxID=2880 RepID=D7FXJ9_ECTSI|nr:conserved unknown protein [Ectocarpus siliculosus]|eukprot:CBJ26440.1 conserved unknown protein [Ectocarpus siliculosus]
MGATGSLHVVVTTALLLLPGGDGFFSVVPRCATSSRAGVALYSSATSDDVRSAEAAKSNLRSALAESGGSTLAEGVGAAVEVLANFNPTSSPAKAWPLHSGEWASVGEDFKGTTRTKDGVECTLGRLVFNIFEPVNLPVLIVAIKNTIGDRPENADPAYESNYVISTRWVARDGSGLRGRVEISGTCWEDPSMPERVLVRFTKGSIEPDEGQDLDAWRKVIGVRDVEGTKDKGPLSTLKEKAARLMLKVVFGFQGPADGLGPRGELSYEMKRSPKGYLDIIYLDEEMRVTRGQQGALVVVDRV